MKLPDKIKIFGNEWKIFITKKSGSYVSYPQQEIYIENLKNENVMIEHLYHEIAEAIFIEMETVYKSNGAEEDFRYIFNHKEMSIFITEFTNTINELKGVI